MSQKPKIQYVGQFYIHGSEARQLELQEKKKRAKSKLPLERLRLSIWTRWRSSASSRLS